MKKLFSAALVIFLAANANAQTERRSVNTVSTDTMQIVEASCGQCQFGMKDKKGCDLAVRINGVPYFVTGTSIDKHGDAHADDGFCNAIRKAKVSGKVVDKNFVATSFTLLPDEKVKP